MHQSLMVVSTVAGGFFKNRCNLPSMIPRKPSLSSLEQSNASVMERLQVTIASKGGRTSFHAYGHNILCVCGYGFVAQRGVETWMRQTGSSIIGIGLGKSPCPLKDKQMHTQESNEPRVEMTNWSWKIKRIPPNHQLLHWKLEETPAVDPWKHHFCVVSRWSNKFKTRAFKALEVSRKCFMAQQVTIFFRYENFRKQKQDKLRIYLQDSCQLRSSCRIHIQPLFRFTCLYFPCPSPGVPKRQLLCRELAPPPKKIWRNLSETSGMFWYGPGFTFANL